MKLQETPHHTLCFEFSYVYTYIAANSIGSGKGGAKGLKPPLF